MPSLRIVARWSEEESMIGVQTKSRFNKDEWHEWFAWYPVTFGYYRDGDQIRWKRAWLTKVWRARFHSYGLSYWDYVEKTEK